MNSPSMRSGIIPLGEYALLLAIIALTGFEFFFRSGYLIYVLVAPLSVCLFFAKRRRIEMRALVLIVLVFVLYILQANAYGLDRLSAVTGTVRFLIYFVVAATLAKDFPRKYVNLMYWLSLASLALYLPSQLSSSFYDFLLRVSSGIQPIGFELMDSEKWTNPNNTLIFYTVPHLYSFRNNGAFWEPGMFAVFVNLALAIGVAKNSCLWNRTNTVMLLAGLSTFSLTSWIASFVICAYYYLLIAKNKMLGLLLVVAAPLIVIPIVQTEYVSEKIDTSILNIEQGYGRVGAMLSHYALIVESPFIGHGGAVLESQARLTEWEGATPNGLTNIIRFYGIPFAIIYYILLYKFSKFCVSGGSAAGYGHLLVFLVLLIVAFSQDVTTRHFYLVLVFLPLVLKQRVVGKNYE